MRLINIVVPIFTSSITVQPAPRPSITAWTTREQKVRFATLAASRGLSESRLLGLMIDSVLARNLTDPRVEQCYGDTPKGDRVTIRLRPGDGQLLRMRAQSRGMNFSTYAATLIRANVRADPPMPSEELARLELGLAQLRAVGVSFREATRAIEQTKSLDPDPARGPLDGPPCTGTVAPGTARSD